jgi:hypothetical protein
MVRGYAGLGGRGKVAAADVLLWPDSGPSCANDRMISIMRRMGAAHLKERGSFLE